MRIRFDHVNVRTPNLAGMIAFYTEVLGLEVGPRPPFTFNGAWLYAGDQAVVHLVEIPEAPRPSGQLRLEHLAFAAEDLTGFVARLRAAGIEYRIGLLAGFGTRQVNVLDPDGNRLHLDFAATEPLPE
jgi:catechol 2,3-dioxygenase-like lactoylglutathione lyase family enzyme